MGDAYKFCCEPIRKREFSETHRSVPLTTDRCGRRRCCRIIDALSDIIVSPNVVTISGQLCCPLIQSSNHWHWMNNDVLAALPPSQPAITGHAAFHSRKLTLAVEMEPMRQKPRLIVLGERCCSYSGFADNVAAAEHPRTGSRLTRDARYHVPLVVRATELFHLMLASWKRMANCGWNEVKAVEG